MYIYMSLYMYIDVKSICNRYLYKSRSLPNEVNKLRIISSFSDPYKIRDKGVVRLRFK